MASYTMQLREYIEQATQDTETMSTRDRIEAGRPKLFDFDYPIFDKDYKKVFETHFIRKFYMREIGFETEELFKFNLETYLTVNMPYFNKLFESELIEFDPLTNTKVDTSKNKTNDKNKTDSRKSTQSGSTNGSSSGSSTQDQSATANGSIFNREIESDQPDTRLTITTNDGSGVLEYASKIKEDNQTETKSNDSNATSSSTESTNVNSNATLNDSGTSAINETEDYIESRIGKIGDQSYSSMINEYRESFMRIENKIFSEMQELFMLVY